ncbi:MAG: response regulator [Pseudomonadota bacterium]
MEDSQNHLAYNKSIESLDVVVLDESRAMQAITRTILQPLRLRRLRFFDNAEQALRDIHDEPPNLMIADWRMRLMPGPKLLKELRSKQSGPIACMPVLMTISGPTRREVELAYRYGAQAVIAKPFSPNAMQRRIQWLLQDARLMRLIDETYVIDGVKETLDERMEAMASENTYTEKTDGAPSAAGAGAAA